MFTYPLTLSATEVSRASEAVLGRHRRWPAFQYLYLVGGILAIPILAINDAPRWTFDSTVGALIAIALGATGLRVFQQRQLRRALATGPGLAEPQQIQLDITGLSLRNSVETTQYAWPAFLEVAETDEFFLFYRAPQVAIYLPKRVVGDATAQEALRGLLRQVIPGERLLIDLPSRADAAI